jgi:homogentisate 1,2-dioxygenase
LLERRTLGQIPPQPHTVFKVKEKVMTEYVFTRDGFAGGFTISYHEDAPTNMNGAAFLSVDYSRLVGSAVSFNEVPNARRHIKTWEAKLGKDLVDCRTAIWVNETCRMSAVRGNVHSEYAFSNGQFDELWFIYEGKGKLLTLLGTIDYGPNDYILIPRGTAYKFENQGNFEAFLTEGSPAIEIPGEYKNPHGQLKLEAPFTHRDFRSPERLLTEKEQNQFLNIASLVSNTITMHTYQSSPAKVLGWDGSVYPLAFNILNFLPKTGKIHLPPNLHQTFCSPKNFVVCSFVPRLVDYGEGAIPCPYPHSNVHCDEVIYYVRGNFTSRKGVSERSASFHPMGLPHGPQPGNYLASVGHKSTDELAVMVDTFMPLYLTRAGLELQDPSYVNSWAE